jgi:hypothetical protein
MWICLNALALLLFLKIKHSAPGLMFPFGALGLNQHGFEDRPYGWKMTHERGI